MKKTRRKVNGTIKIHPDGFAFVAPDPSEQDPDSELAEIYVASRSRAGALDGDRVAVQYWSGTRGLDGRVTDVLQRHRTRITGEVPDKRARTAKDVFIPDDPRIHNPVRTRGGLKDLKPGKSVVAEIVHYPEAPDDPIVVKPSKVLGDRDDPRTEIEKILIGANVDDGFEARVQKETKQVPDKVRPEDLIDRTDLRDLPFATIDPETARDFDDAVALEQLPDGNHRLWVAVADVSHYVMPGTEIDKEAFARATSIYLPNRAIPMLPEPLSAHICSLVPHEDRCAMVTRIDFDRSGKPIDSDFCAAVIHSKARLDYPGVAAALSGDLRGRRRLYQPWLPTLEKMAELAKVLRNRRMQRGALDLDLPEASVVLDEDDPKRVRDVRRARKDPKERQAYNLIEEFMLAANEAVARSFTDRNEPTLWRVHASPAPERLEVFINLAESYGIRFSADALETPRGMGDVLEQLKGHAAQKPLSFQLLRSLKQASYETKNVGHFGLAAPDYVHFTSPIRRYPDLVAHRLMKQRLANLGRPSGGFKRGGDSPEVALEKLAVQAQHTSSRERRAQDIEREAIDVYRTFFMRDRLGDVFDGTITGVTAFGIFVQVDDPFVEGLVRLEDLPDDSYAFDDRTLRLVGEHNGLVLGLGQSVKVQIAAVSVQRRKIDMHLHGMPESLSVPGGKGRGRGRKARWRSPDKEKNGSRHQGEDSRKGRKGRKGKAKGKSGGKPDSKAGKRTAKPGKPASGRKSSRKSAGGKSRWRRS